MKALKFLPVVALVAIVLSSCDFETQAFKKMRYQRDSLQVLQDQTTARIDEYFEIINEVDSSFEVIRANENYISLNSGTDGMPTNEIRQRMADNFYTINQIIEDNKARIAELEEKVKAGDANAKQLQKAIAKLKAQIEQKNEEILSLQQQLEQKNIKIDSLVVENQMIEEQAKQFAEEMERQSQTIQEQDSLMNRGFYLVMDKRSLKENNVDAKNMSSTFRQSLFTTIDIREFESLNTESKRAKLLTKHPETSYTLERDENKKYVLVIKNASDFWSTSRYLIIQVD